MKAGKWIGVGMLITLGVIVAGMAVFWLLSGLSFWRMPLMAASRHESSPIEATACEDNRIGMMGRTGWESGCDSLSLNPPSPAAETITANQCISEGNNKQVACPGQLIIPSDTLNSDMNSLDSVRDIVDDYILDLDYVGIEITEIMEFEHNYYAVVMDIESGIGVMELLVDKKSRIVRPEMGPNMMWNARFGMHSRGNMMGTRSREENEISADEAIRLGQEWLYVNFPENTIDTHADKFYGYYTIHTLKDGVIDGMLSVHGTTGQVWYHSWHGAYIQMLEIESLH